MQTDRRKVLIAIDEFFNNFFVEETETDECEFCKDTLRSTIFNCRPVSPTLVIDTFSDEDEDEEEATTVFQESPHSPKKRKRSQFQSYPSPIITRSQRRKFRRFLRSGASF